MLVSNHNPRKPLKEDRAAIRAAILHVMNRMPGLTQYQIVKALFLADRAHLNKWGRPVTFDNYCAMFYGPVPSLSYDLLKPNNNYKTIFHEDHPWKSAPNPRNPKARTYFASMEADYDHLSGSDIEELDAAVDIVSKLDFDGLKNLTHRDPAWKAAWAQHTKDADSIPMKLALLLDNGDGERLEKQLIYTSNAA